MNFDHITDNTRINIEKLIPKNHYLIKNNDTYQILKQLQNSQNVINSKCIQILLDKKLITNNKKLTSLGNAVLLTHVFDVDLLSIFLLAYIWNIQQISDIMFCTKPSIEKFLYMYDQRTINNRLSKLRKQNFLSYSNKRSVLRINLDIYKKLSTYKTILLSIIEHIYDLDEQIQGLINKDPLLLKNRKTNELIWMQQV